MNGPQIPVNGMYQLWGCVPVGIPVLWVPALSGRALVNGDVPPFLGCTSLRDVPAFRDVRRPGMYPGTECTSSFRWDVPVNGPNVFHGCTSERGCTSEWGCTNSALSLSGDVLVSQGCTSV
ncbi:hypothetical protein AVEN_249930-1 [Araneus ventricosus]|uniref:Uncharacterized protein n=1 Tax=Araneus ventricosus TaxID=182803 RepID=A0A4Y2E0V9_ARAVE|nr:hypothetical protein AVEN_249930-1 [Araneus ventricosus]